MRRRELCWELIKDDFCLKEMMITIGTTDSNKTLDTLILLCGRPYSGEGPRYSLMINLGGMVTDLGGFTGINIQAGH